MMQEKGASCLFNMAKRAPLVLVGLEDRFGFFFGL